ncbi:hypothetical protein LNO89_01045 [Klebsiella pneumoniae subsp. pneumoniae]|nr:hypothetical protein [Klebsiella pneumoniae subsp. pneumoniae]
MVADQAIKQGFVGVLDVTQINMFVDFSFESLILDPGAFRLSSIVSTTSGSRPSRLKLLRSSILKALPFVEQGEFKQNGTRVGDVQGTVFLMGKLHRTNSLIMTTVPARR